MIGENMNIIVSGGWGYSNIGDCAIAASTKYLLEQYYSDSNIIYTSYDVDEFYRNHGVKAIASVHKLIENHYKNNGLAVDNYLDESIPELIDYMNHFDKNSVFIMSGGGYVFMNWDVQIFARILEIEMAKRKQAKVLILAQSIGPILNPVLKNMFIESLNKCDRISVRDTASKEYLMKAGIKDVYLVPDIAILMSDIYMPRPQNNKTVINIFLSDYFEYQPNCEKFFRRDEKRKLVGRVRRKIERIEYRYNINRLIQALSQDYNINFVQSNSWATDLNYTDRVINKLAIRNYHIFRNLTLNEMCDVISNGSFTISCKMHPLIISASYGIPCIGFSYNYKLSYFMQLIEREFACFKTSKISFRRCKQLVDHEVKLGMDYARIQSVKDELQNKFLNLMRFNECGIRL